MLLKFNDLDNFISMCEKSKGDKQLFINVKAVGPLYSFGGEEKNHRAFTLLLCTPLYQILYSVTATEEQYMANYQKLLDMDGYTDCNTMAISKMVVNDSCIEMAF